METDTISDRFDASIEPSHLPPEYVAVDTGFAQKLTTRHSRTFEVELTDEESFTRDLPNVGYEALDALDDRGLVRVETTVAPGDILVGKTVALAGQKKTPEEKLLLSIFGEKAGDVRDVSLRVPPGCAGMVSDATIDDDSARVVVTWESPLEVGDELLIGDRRVAVAAIRSLGADIAWGDGSGGPVGKVSMARDVVHARSIGPYTPRTQQPTEGREAFGGQPVTREQAEVLAAHAPWNLWEMFTAKSDCISERTRAYEGIVKGANPDIFPAPAPEPTPEADSSVSNTPEGGASGGMPDIFQFFESQQKTAPGEAPCVLGESVKLLVAYLRALGVELAPRAPELAPRLLSDEDVRTHSFGELRSADRWDEEKRPVPGGLHCAKTFGPVDDYRCICGKYARMKHRGVVCEKCGVEVIQSKVRRERFGHIELAAACENPFFAEQRIEALGMLPPDLRDDEIDGRYAAVIARNDAVRELQQSGSDAAVHDASRALQEAVDALFSAGENSLRTAVESVWSSSILTKTVDYSGVASVVVDPDLPGDTCRLPLEMTMELFKPWTYSALEYSGYVTTIKSGKQMVEQRKPEALGANREACEGYPVLLCGPETVVARKVTRWEHPAIAVDPRTARLLEARRVSVHVPLTDEAALECSQMSDVTSPRTRKPRGWLAPAVDGDLFEPVRRAARAGLSDPLRHPFLAAAFGRPPQAPDAEALRRFRDREEARRERLREEWTRERREAREAEREEVPAAPWLERGVHELALSVETYELLMNAGVSTIGDLCRRTEAEMLKTRGFGRGQLKEVKALLADLGLSLGMRL